MINSASSQSLTLAFFLKALYFLKARNDAIQDSLKTAAVGDEKGGCSSHFKVKLKKNKTTTPSKHSKASQKCYGLLKLTIILKL